MGIYNQDGMEAGTQDGSLIDRSNSRIAEQNRSPLDSSLNQLGETVARAHELVDRLESRLRPITTPIPQNDVKARDMDLPNASETVSRVIATTIQVDIINERIRQLLDTVEV